MASFFSFASQPVEVEIKLAGEEDRRTVEVKGEKDKKEICPVYYDGESVVGQVSVEAVREPGCVAVRLEWLLSCVPLYSEDESSIHVHRSEMAYRFVLNIAAVRVNQSQPSAPSTSAETRSTFV